MALESLWSPRRHMESSKEHVRSIEPDDTGNRFRDLAHRRLGSTIRLHVNNSILDVSPRPYHGLPNARAMLDEIARAVDHSGRNATRAARTEGYHLTVRMLKNARAAHGDETCSCRSPEVRRVHIPFAEEIVDEHARIARNLSRCFPE